MSFLSRLGIRRFGLSQPTKRHRVRQTAHLRFEALEDRCVLASGLSASLVADIIPGSSSSSPHHLTNVNGTLYFGAGTTAGQLGAWMSDGTAAGTVLLKTVAPDGVASEFTAVGGNVFFSAYGYLWKTDGTAKGTVLVKQLELDPHNLTTVNGKLLFTSPVGDAGNELWVTTGSSRGTKLIKDIYPGGHWVSSRSGRYWDANDSSPGQLIDLNGMVFFAATDGINGRELWKSDGTEKGTTLVKDLAPGLASSNPSFLTVVNSAVYFAAGGGLWRSDGTAAGTVLVKDRLFMENSMADMANVNGTLFFQGNDGVNGTELWKSDGTAPGTIMVKDIIPGSAGANPSNLINVNGTLFFSADGASGQELWRSDGTATGTFLVKDINPGSVSSIPSGLTNVNGRLYFAANDGVNGKELWQSDGTEAGTVMVQDIYPGSMASSPNYLVAKNNKLYFAATDAVHGRELWDPPAVETAKDYLLIPSKDTDNVLSYNAATGAFVDEFVRHKDGRLNQPTGAIVGPYDAAISASGDLSKLGRSTELNALTPAPTSLTQSSTNIATLSSAAPIIVGSTTSHEDVGAQSNQKSRLKRADFKAKIIRHRPRASWNPILAAANPLRLLLVWLLPAAVSWMPAPAPAQTLPPFGRVRFEEGITSNAPGGAVGQTGDTPEQIEFDYAGMSQPGAANPFSYGISARVITSGGSRPMVDVTGNLTASGLGAAGGHLDASANGQIQYSFQVRRSTPPAGSVSSIPVVIKASGHVSASPGAGASASARLTNESTFLVTQLGNITTSGGLQEFDFNMPVGFRAGEIGTFSLMAGGGGGVSEGTVMFQALVDPTVEIDPTFPFKDSFEIVFNTPSVAPEPASALCLGVGMIGVLTARRSRARRSNVASVLGLLLMSWSSTASAGILQVVKTTFTPGGMSAPVEDRHAIFGLSDSDINADITASISGDGYHAIAGAGRFGQVGLDAESLGISPGSTLVASVLVASDEYVNPFGVPAAVRTQFVIDGGLLQDFFSISSVIRFTLEVGASNEGSAARNTIAGALEISGSIVAHLGAVGLYPGGGYQVDTATDASGARTFSTTVMGDLDLHATYNSAMRQVEIPLSFQTLDLGTLNPNDRLLIAYQAQVEIIQNGVAEGFHGQFSDPFTLSGTPNLILGMNVTIEPVPEPASLSTLLLGVLLTRCSATRTRSGFKSGNLWKRR